MRHRWIFFLKYAMAGREWAKYANKCNYWSLPVYDLRNSYILRVRRVSSNDRKTPKNLSSTGSFVREEKQETPKVGILVSCFPQVEFQSWTKTLGYICYKTFVKYNRDSS